MTLLVTGAVLLTMDPARPEPFRGWLRVGADGRIAALGSGDPPAAGSAPAADTVLDAGGAFVAPGFVSAHSHLFTSGSRGLGTDQGLYGWIDAMTRYTRHATTDDIYWLVRHGALDFLSNGITTAYDFADSGLPFEKVSDGVSRFAAALPDGDYQHAQLRAKVDAGLRHLHGVSLGSAPQADTFAYLDDLVERAKGCAAEPTHLGLAINGSVQWAETPDAAAVELAAMRRHGLVNQAHLMETPHEIELQRSKFGWYADAGALGPDLLFGHFIQTTDEIARTAAAAGCGMVWQPMSNGRLASGVAPIPRYRELGMRVGIGLDDQSCTDVSDPFANMRFGIGLLRATYRDPAAMPVRDMLELHTRGAAEVLGLGDQVGSLAVGRYADLLVVDPRSPDVGPVWDPVATYVLACGQRNVKAVYVGGELAVSDGVVVASRDPARVSAELHDRLERIRRTVDA